MARKITFEDGGTITVSPSGEVTEFKAGAAGLALTVGDVVLDPEHIHPGLIVEYQCQRYGTIQEVGYPVLSVEEVTS